MKAFAFCVFGSLMAMGPVQAAQLAHFAPASTVAWGDPLITGIHVENSNVVVTAQVPAGFQKVVLEGSDRMAGSAWLPKAVARPNGQSGQLVFRLALGAGLELLRLRADKSDPLPEYFYSGISDFEGQPASGGSVVYGSSYVSTAGRAGSLGMDVITLDSTAAGGTPPRAVVESDIWKVQGDTLYFFNQYRGLQVIDIRNPDAPVITGTLPLSAAGEQMYLLEDGHVVLLTRDGCNWSSASDSQAIVVEVVGGIPVQVAAMTISGTICESRLVGSALYVASHVYRVTSITTSGVWQSGTAVESYDLADPRHPIVRSTEWIPNGYNAVVSATDRFLFVAREPENYSTSEGPVSVFDISAPDGTMTLASTLRPAGRVKDKFKLNLTGDVLTVVSEKLGPATVVETFSLANPATPQKLGSLTIIEGETLYATRFDGERLYVVTFRQIDPLWLVDLSDPRAPRITGELQVPGFSTYLAPMGDRLLAIGRDTTGGWKTILSLFDVADAANPALLKRVDLGDSHSYSEANEDEKALGVFPEHGLVLVPFTTYASNRTVQAVQLVDLGRDSLALRGRVEHPIQARRATVHRDRILSLSGREMLSVDATDRDRPVVRATTLLSWPVDQVFLSGDFLVELSRAETGGAVLRVASTGSPDNVANQLVLTNLPFLGATEKDGRLYIAQGTMSQVWYEPGGGLTGYRIVTNYGAVCLTVLDTTQLPLLPVLGQVTLPFDQRQYGTWTPSWPRPGLLVWALTGSDYYYYDSYVRPVFTLIGVPGAIQFTSVQSPAFLPVVTLRPSFVTAVDSAFKVTPLLPVWRYDPWSWDLNQRFVAFDVSEPHAPVLVSDVNLDSGNNSASVARVFATNNLVYAGHHRYESVVIGTNSYLTTNIIHKTVTNVVTVTNLISVPHYSWVTNVEPVTNVAMVCVLNRPAAFQAWQSPGAPLAGWLSAGGAHSLLVTPGGDLLAWGGNGMGQLGTSSSSEPRGQLLPVPDLGGVSAAAAGLSHSLALKQDGTVWAWGSGSQGQLGGGEPAQTWPPVPYLGSPVASRVSGISNAVSISAGASHSLAVAADGTIWQWGKNWADLNSEGSLQYTARLLPGVADARSVCAGYDHSLAVTADGAVWSWGRNGYGQLGGAPGDSRSAAVVPSLPKITAVGANLWYSLALAEDGSVYGWGLNSAGVLGSGTAPGTVRAAPSRISGLDNIVALAAGRDHALALKRDGSLWAWGSNAYGQCGETGVTATSVPLPVRGCSNVVSFAAGRWYSLALTAQGELWGWGASGDMQLGDGLREVSTNAVFRTNVTQVVTYTYETNIVQEPRIEIVYVPVVVTNSSPITATYQKHYLDVIDYTVPANPAARPPVSVPGGLCGISHGGALLFTTATRYTGQTLRSDSEWLDAVAYDGVAAHLVDSLPLTNSYSSPVLVQDGVVYVTRAGSGTNAPPQLEAWTLPGGKFTRTAALGLAAAGQGVGVYSGLLAVPSASGIQLFDVSDPVAPNPIMQHSFNGCFGFDLQAADGSLEQGLWLPLGEMGLWHAGR